MELIFCGGARTAREHKTAPTGEQRECSCETPPQNITEAGSFESQACIYDKVGQDGAEDVPFRFIEDQAKEDSKSRHHCQKGEGRNEYLRQTREEKGRRVP